MAQLKTQCMYSSLLTSHKIIVTLFLLHYILKLVLLLLDRKQQLAAYTKATRVIEILLSVGFLVTGGWMLFSGAVFNFLLIIKLVCVFGSIPLAVVGFKKGNKALAALAVFLIVTAYGLAEMNRKAKTGGAIDTSTVSADPIAAGKLIYSQTCINCHGSDGKMGGSGAKDLSVSILTAEQKHDLIRNGKNAMPAYKDLTEEQVNDVIQYIATLK